MTSDEPRAEDAVDADEFCRRIEAYICRKNDGHLIRISGPAFELVRGWAAQGMPLKVAYAGIDRTFERYYRKGPRRRPLHVTFCEADVLDVFDEWQRALGVPQRVADAAAGDGRPQEAGAPEEHHRSRSAGSLPAHLDRVLTRLTLLRGSDRHRGAAWDEALDAAVRALDALAARARQARGDVRIAMIAELATIDRTLLASARNALDDAARAEIGREAVIQLEPFRERMTPDAHAAAVAAAADRLIRQAAGLPTLAYGD